MLVGCPLAGAIDGQAGRLCERIGQRHDLLIFQLVAGDHRNRFARAFDGLRRPCGRDHDGVKPLSSARAGTVAKQRTRHVVERKKPLMRLLLV